MRHLKADAFTNLTPHKLPVENMTARSSSIRQVVLHGAKLNIQQRCVGRVRLPMNRQEDFIREFNRIYSDVDMQLEPFQQDEKKSPES